MSENKDILRDHIFNVQSVLEAKIIECLANKGFVFKTNAELCSFLSSRCDILKTDKKNFLMLDNDPICYFTDTESVNPSLDITDNSVRGTIYFEFKEI